MTQGDGLVQVREIDGILGLDHGAAYRMMRKGIFFARKLRTNIWVVEERELAAVLDRIIRYRAHKPFYSALNMTVDEAGAALRLSHSAIYGLLARGELDTAENEHWKCATKESVNRMARRRGLREVA